ncbi:unnamed protein product [Brassica napus]|uniref:(rape) hypothetical protein n=1 Tax=Brassica napus TaxID=3708 RepID=A0A816P5V7_BRANA|nr:unnamed protein product [Brassica napus]
MPPFPTHSTSRWKPREVHPNLSFHSFLIFKSDLFHQRFMKIHFSQNTRYIQPNTSLRVWMQLNKTPYCSCQTLQTFM